MLEFEKDKGKKIKGETHKGAKVLKDVQTHTFEGHWRGFVIGAEACRRCSSGVHFGEDVQREPCEPTTTTCT